MERASKNVDLAKTIDIFAVFHDHVACPPINKHRTLIRQTIEGLSDRYSVCTKPIRNQNEFIETISKSKIVVAPYGFGERIASDQFAILSGTVLVKAECRRVVTFPDIYNEDCITMFQPDCSDLVDKIDHVFQNYTLYRDQTMMLRERLVNISERDIKQYVLDGFKNLPTTTPTIS
jgi:hypothetical protein